MKIKNIIFDFDDTLIDFSHARDKITSHLNKFCKKKYGVNSFGNLFDEIDIEMTIKARTDKNPQIDNRSLWAKITGKRLGLDLTKAQCEEIRRLYWKIVRQNTKTLPHTKEVLRKLKKKYTLFVLSDADGESPNFKIKRVKEVSLNNFFKGFSFGDKLRTTKPDMKFYSYLIKKYKINPKECLMVGDKPQYDLIFAKKLGMTTIWFRHGRWAGMHKSRKFNYIDYAINDVRKLFKILK